MARTRVAIPVWGDRMSTVFDFARKLNLVDLGASGEIGRIEIAFGAGPPVMRAARLAQNGADVLICGAISRPLARLVAAHGIQVIPFVRGTVDEVVQAYRTGQLQQPRFLLPGFRPFAWRIPRGGRRFRGGR